MNDAEKVYRARCIIANVGRGLSQQNAMYLLFDLLEVGDSGSGNVAASDTVRTLNKIVDESLVRIDVQHNMARKGR